MRIVVTGSSGRLGEALVRDLRGSGHEVADLAGLGADAPAVVARLCPDFPALYGRLGWRMFPGIDRVYANDRARAELGRRPHYDFRRALDLLAAEEPPRSPLARRVGVKGYHGEPTGPYTAAGRDRG